MRNTGHNTIPGMDLGDITEHRGFEGPFQRTGEYGADGYGGCHVRSGGPLIQGRRR